MTEDRKKVILDTNFLLVPYCYRVDIFSELSSTLSSGYDIILPSSTICELKSLSKRKGKEGLAAKLALKILELRKLEITVIETNLKPDNWILSFIQKEKAIICTNDKELKKKIKRFGLNVISLRSKSKLSLE